MALGYANPYTTVAQADEASRAGFYKKTYLHVAAAILAFIGIEALLLQLPIAGRITQTMVGGQFSWLIVLVAFMAVSWIAEKWAHSSTSKGMQYAGLALYTVAWSVLSLPLILFATIKQEYTGQNIIAQAGIVTLLLVAGITVVAFTTKKDFSFLGSFLKIAFFVALGVIVAGMLFNFSLGIVFAGAMALIASASILYTTSNIIHHYNTEQYVAASLALFAGIVMLFWYVLQIFMSRD